MNMLSALRRCLHSRYLVCFLDARKRRRPTEDGTGHKWNNYNTQSEFSGTWSVTNCTTVTQRLGYTFIRKLCENKFPNLPGQFSAPLWNENRMIFSLVGQGEANASNSHLIHLELVWKIIRRPVHGCALSADPFNTLPAKAIQGVFHWTMACVSW